MAMMLIGLTSSTLAAQSWKKQGKDSNFTRYRDAQPIVFVERGVEFLIFPDGSFDFNTNHDGFYSRSTLSRRSSINTTYGTYGNRVKFSKRRSRGVQIIHDRFGNVRRIGNVFINYNRNGKVKRVGSVFMAYNRGNGRLKQVGGLRVKYNHWGKIAHLSGTVNRFNANLNCGVSRGFDDYAYNFEDDDFYYKQNGKTKRKKRK